MKKACISPSMMCVDLTNFAESVSILDSANVDYFHVDIMDGHFVPNLMLNKPFVDSLRKLSRTPVDFHFMVERPENMLYWFDIRKGDIVSVHLESTPHLNKVLQNIKRSGAKAFVAINPSTPANALLGVVADLDGVLVMTVNPGFAGQSLVESAMDKIREVRSLLDEKGREDCSVEVDGNVSFVNATRMRKLGADIFVCGTSSVFNKDFTIAEGVNELRDRIAAGENI